MIAMYDRRIRTLFAAVLVSAATGTGIAAIPPGEVLSFDVTRNGKEMGSHVIRFTEQGDRTIVDIDIAFRAGLGPITFFRYEHSNREVW